MRSRSPTLLLALVAATGCVHAAAVPSGPSTSTSTASTIAEAPAPLAAQSDVPADLGPDKTAPPPAALQVDKAPTSERRPTMAKATEPVRDPFDGMSDDELRRMVRDTPGDLGSLSVGFPSNGRLMNGIQLPESELYELVVPNQAWGTRETIEYLETAARRVHELFPDTPPLPVGDLSRKSGGYLSPHLSHQSGRDVDVAYYYRDGSKWYSRGTASNLDLERTWAYVRALVTETDVEMILIDHSIQRLLREHALQQGEDPDWVESLFRTRGNQQAIIRHVKGHATHIHVRFFNPLAQRRAQRVYSMLLENKLVQPVVVYTHYKVRRGDTLGRLAKRYSVSVKEIQRANGLRNSKIIAGRSYKIPRRGGPNPDRRPLAIPPRRLPPAR